MQSCTSHSEEGGSPTRESVPRQVMIAAAPSGPRNDVVSHFAVCLMLVVPVFHLVRVRYAWRGCTSQPAAA